MTAKTFHRYAQTYTNRIYYIECMSVRLNTHPIPESSFSGLSFPTSTRTLSLRPWLGPELSLCIRSSGGLEVCLLCIIEVERYPSRDVMHGEGRARVGRVPHGAWSVVHCQGQKLSRRARVYGLGRPLGTAAAADRQGPVRVVDASVWKDSVICAVVDWRVSPYSVSNGRNGRVSLLRSCFPRLQTSKILLSGTVA